MLAGVLAACGFASAGEPYAPTKRYASPTMWILGPWYATGAPKYGGCACPPPHTFEREVDYELEHFESNNLPVTVFLADGEPWGEPEKDGRWRGGAENLKRFEKQKIRVLLHYWGGGQTEEQWKRAHADVGQVLGGFYFDDYSTVKQIRECVDFMQRIMPGDAEIIMKAYQYGGDVKKDQLARYGTTCYVNDLCPDYGGLREGIRRVFEYSDVLPAPFNEFTAYEYKQKIRPDEETFFRRLHFGAMQVVMAHTPFLHCDPWADGYSPDLLKTYRYWSWVHWELAPYLYSYLYNAYETNQPVLREPNSKDYSVKLGDEFFVKYITEPNVKETEVNLPAGEWIDYWDLSRVVKGPTALRQPCPPGREPTFIKNGAIIPLRVKNDETRSGTSASEGSLTVRVFPSGESRFHYRDDAGKAWQTFTSSQSGNGLKVEIDKSLSRPVLYRIERWPEAPKSVSADERAVQVNGAGKTPRLNTEEAVNGSTTPAWFYDEKRRLLIVKALVNAKAAEGGL